MESLRMALSFVKKQVDEKRASLKDLEKKVSREIVVLTRKSTKKMMVKVGHMCFV